MEKQGQSREGANLYTVDFAKVGRSPLFFSPHQLSSLLPPHFFGHVTGCKFQLVRPFPLVFFQQTTSYRLLALKVATPPLASQQHPNKQQTAVLLSAFHCAPVNVLSICLARTLLSVDGQQGDKQPSTLTLTPLEDLEFPTRLQGGAEASERKLADDENLQSHAIGAAMKPWPCCYEVHHHEAHNEAS